VSAAQGRCAGCGEDGELRAAEWHALSCPDLAELIHAGKKPLDPGPEYERWRREDLPAERAAATAGRVGRVQAAREAGADRFRTRPDILEAP